VDSAALVKAGLMRRSKDGVRLLGNGEFKAKVKFEVFGASKSAVAAGREGRRLGQNSGTEA
jgi:large subunit ribosomal protein L15